MTDSVISLPIRILVLLLLLVIVAPLAVPMLMAFSDTPFLTFPPQGFTLRWFERVLFGPEAQTSFLFSLQLAFLATITALLLGVPAAAALVRYEFRGRSAIIGLMLSPVIVPLIVTGVALLQMFSSLGWGDTLTQLVIGHAVVCLPYVVRSVTASFVLVNRDLEDAAAVMGAPPHKVLTKIVWPQVRPGILAGAVFSFVVSFDDYPISMWLADGRHFPIPLYLHGLLERSIDPSIAAISTLVILFALLLVVVIEKVFGISIARLAT
ncbi:ABC-type transporter, permease component: POPT family [Devosia sp. LC5]|uniref:ABC transporter permease n=1 Tax=Devosia sp. LC5 TaxID=1502724 RepID=UPI0004E2FE1D|nr:ABC transporter permease [Devosia sp. LC5]KFC69919.1 ABC-type transporter, permease component: POPT family [Devosia sp. LC5]